VLGYAIPLNILSTGCLSNRGQPSVSGWTLEVKRVRLKYTLVQTLRLCTSRTAHRGIRGIALLFLDHGTRRGWGVSVTPRPLFTHGKDPVPIVQEGGWSLGPVWTGVENLAPTGIRSPDRTARSHSLYRLRYPAHIWGELTLYCSGYTNPFVSIFIFSHYSLETSKLLGMSCTETRHY
jgi:hypothetical protein